MYSKRNETEKDVESDILIYDQLPLKIRNQIIYIFDDIAEVTNGKNEKLEFHRKVRDKLRRELGVETLPSKDDNNGVIVVSIRELKPDEEIKKFFRTYENLEHLFDLIHIYFSMAWEIVAKKHIYFHAELYTKIHDLAKELNQRFSENQIGYQFKNAQIIRVDSKYIHEDVEKPVFNLLNQPTFSEANKNFMSARKHYLNNDFDEAIISSHKAFESTIKVISSKRNWKIDPKNIDSIINKLFESKHMPKNHRQHLKKLLECQKTIRNNSAHGNQEKTSPPSREVVRYMLHSTAASILFFAESLP